jgi:hypothetical protein
MAYWDFPVSSYKSVLLEKTDCSSLKIPPGVLSRRTTDLWSDIVCSRGAAEVHPSESCRCTVAAGHDLKLRQTYVLNLTVVSGVLLASMLFMRAGARVSQIFGTVLVVLNLVNVASVPLTYGRLIATTIFPMGKVIVKPNEADAADSKQQLPAATGTRPRPAPDNTDSAAVSLTGEPGPVRFGYLLSQSATQIWFFEPKVHSIVSLPTSTVREINIDDRKDILHARMTQ